ncbi:hypothetical protein CDAR_287031 [Caerostris darwini]|uniref:Uncharacterized protein n=1 Tax=Caerostris darwini TaxID=1538125 RepID=A0AAV4RH57_9ARAC|nr:hypothetical protein CDAR_287031 [Caerostris darwini]
MKEENGECLMIISIHQNSANLPYRPTSFPSKVLSSPVDHIGDFFLGEGIKNKEKVSELIAAPISSADQKGVSFNRIRAARRQKRNCFGPFLPGGGGVEPSFAQAARAKSLSNLEALSHRQCFVPLEGTPAPRTDLRRKGLFLSVTSKRKRVSKSRRQKRPPPFSPTPSRYPPRGHGKWRTPFENSECVEKDVILKGNEIFKIRGAREPSGAISSDQLLRPANRKTQAELGETPSRTFA